MLDSNYLPTDRTAPSALGGNSAGVQREMQFLLAAMVLALSTMLARLLSLTMSVKLSLAVPGIKKQRNSRAAALKLALMVNMK